jgi:hypothetical protein
MPISKLVNYPSIHGALTEIDLMGFLLADSKDHSPGVMDTGGWRFAAGY